MNCIINETLNRFKGKQANTDVISRYMRIKHRIKLDTQVLLRRLQALQ